MNKGFTLIELLVVVLIVGILAAVALPQYTKAVEKSRTAEAVTLLGDIMTGQRIYLLGHATCASTLDLLDIDVPAQTNNFDISIDAANSCIAKAARRNVANGNDYTISFTLTPASGAIAKACDGSNDAICTAVATSW